MAFINKLCQMNAGELVVNTESGYSYEEFMEDMLLIETAINNTVNKYCRTINEYAIEKVLNEGANTEPKYDDDIKEEKESIIEKLKKLWQRIVDSFFKMVDSIYNWIYERVVLEKRFIEKNKDYIMRTTLVYGKDIKQAEVLGDVGNSGYNYEINVSYPDIHTSYKIWTFTRKR